MLTFGTSRDNGRNLVPLLGPPTRMTALVGVCEAFAAPRTGTFNDMLNLAEESGISKKYEVNMNLRKELQISQDS